MLELSELYYEDKCLLVAPYKANVKAQQQNEKKQKQPKLKTGRNKKTTTKKRKQLQKNNNFVQTPKENGTLKNNLSGDSGGGGGNPRTETKRVDLLDLLRGANLDEKVPVQNSRRWTPPIFHNFIWQASPNMMCRYDFQGKLVQSKIIVSRDEEDNYYEDEGNFRVKWPSF